MATDLGIMLGAFFGVTVIASLAGAVNTGVAAGIGHCPQLECPDVVADTIESLAGA